MKKYYLSTILFAIVVSLLPVQVIGNEKDTEKLSDEVKSESSAEITMEVKNLYNRLVDISELKSNELSSSEKKELRKETRTIKKELRSYSKADAEAYAVGKAEASGNGGIFISTGALIIIILILILV